MADRDEVSTINGIIPGGALGRTLMHEHLFVQSLEITKNYSTTWVSDDVRVAGAIATLNELFEVGIRTIVDLTVLGLGRDIGLMSRVAQGTDLNIVAATGAYVLDRLPFQLAFNPPGAGGPVADALAEWFVTDIAEGIAGTSIKAGAIKAATDVAGLTDDVVTTLRAAAMASMQTGVCIITHADAKTERGLDQQQVFREEGVDLTRVVIGHAGDSLDLKYLRQLMDAGSTIGMDRFGLGPPSTEERTRVVAELCELGYADRMVLSHDAACHSEWLDSDRMAVDAPEWNFTLVPNKVVPSLRQLGVTGEQIEMMLVGNPRRILTAEITEGRRA